MRITTKPKRKSTKESKPNFVLTLKLETEKYQEDILDKRLDIGRRIYNACLNELNKRYGLMVESKEYQKAIKLPKGDTTRNPRLQELVIKYRLTEYSLHDFVKPMQAHFKKNLDSHAVQTIATRCFKAFKGKLYHTAKKIHFKKYGELQSLEGKTNVSGQNHKIPNLQSNLNPSYHLNQNKINLTHSFEFIKLNYLGKLCLNHNKGEFTCRSESIKCLNLTVVLNASLTPVIIMDLVTIVMLK